MTSTGRPLIALEGGPRSGHWYWLSDWHILLDSVRAQHFPPAHPATTALHYQPTGRQVDNPHPQYEQGEVWLYTPPPHSPLTPTASTTPVAPERTCVRCGNRLLLHRPGRDRCARCEPGAFHPIPLASPRQK